MKTMIKHLATCASTNDEAWKYLNDPTICAVSARRQTAGRGRLGRQWLSEPDVGLYLSWVGQPGFAFNLGGAIPLLAAVAVAEVLEPLGVNPTLKWPNDLLLNRRKLGGILCEARGSADEWGVVIGIGINLKTPPTGWPQDLTAIAVDDMTNHPFESQSLASNIVLRLNHWVKRVELDGLSPVLSEWMKRSVPVGTHIRWGGHSGEFDGLNDDGSLRFRTQSGTHSVHSGDVLLSSQSET